MESQGTLYRIHVFTVLLLAAGMISGSLYPLHQGVCSPVINTDIVLAVADSRATARYSWSGLTLSHGLRHFINNFLSACDYTKVRVSIVAFSDTVRLQSAFTNNLSSLQLAVKQWSPEFRATRTFLALRFIRTYIRVNARPNAAKVVIVVTPSRSDNYWSTIGECLLLRHEHVHIIGVGYGHYRPTNELIQMTGSNRKVFLARADYYLYHSVLGIKKLICEISKKFKDKLTTTTIPTTTRLTTTTQRTTRQTTTTQPTTRRSTTTQPTTTITTQQTMIPTAIMPILELDAQITTMATRTNIIVLLDHSRGTHTTDGVYDPAIISFFRMFVDMLSLTKCPTGISIFDGVSQTRQTITDDSVLLNTAITALEVDKTVPTPGSKVSAGILDAIMQLINRGQPDVSKVLVVLIVAPSDNDAVTRATAVAAQFLGISTWVVTFPGERGTGPISALQQLDIARDPGRIRIAPNGASLPQIGSDLAEKICPS